MYCKEFEFKDIYEAIEYLSNKDKELHKEGDIVIPTRIIKVLKNRYNSNLDDNELYNTCINSFKS